VEYREHHQRFSRPFVARGQILELSGSGIIPLDWIPARQQFQIKLTEGRHHRTMCV